MNPILKIALRHTRPGTGSTNTFLNRRTALQPLPIPNLNAILKEIPWVLAGGLATRAYMPERVTQNIMILIHLDDQSRARAAFRAAGYTLTDTLAFFCHPERSEGSREESLACQAQIRSKARSFTAFRMTGFGVKREEREHDPAMTAFRMTGFGVKREEREHEPAIDVIACNASWVDLALAKPGRDAAGFPAQRAPGLVAI